MLSVDLVFHVVSVLFRASVLFRDSPFIDIVKAALFSRDRGGPWGPRAEVPFAFYGA